MVSVKLVSIKASCLYLDFILTTLLLNSLDLGHTTHNNADDNVTINALDPIKQALMHTMLLVMSFAHPHVYAMDLQQKAQAWLADVVAQHYPDASAEIHIGRLDSRLKLSPCKTLNFSLPTGASLWRNGSLAVQCSAPQAWQLYLSYQISLTGPALVLKTPVASRHPLSLDDFTLTEVRYLDDPGTYLLALPKNATARRPMKSGQPLQTSDLLLPDLIQAGSKVWVRVNGSGFSVGQEGKALNSAKVGESVRVKMPNGRLIRGTANPSGEVEIAP